MFRWVGLSLVLMLLLPGCAATSLMVGVREPELTKIQVGDTRHQVEGMLGKRQWQPGSADGLTYDIYQYEVGRPARPALGAVALIVDVYSLGMTELSFGDARKFAPVKQVAVAYDEQDRVRFVSQPWLLRAVGPCKRMRVLIPADSGIPSTAPQLPTERPASAASAVAVLELDGPDRVTIDGRSTKGRVELPPGRHAVNYGATGGGSVMLAGPRSYKDSFEVKLLPSHLYRFKKQRLYGWGSRVDVFWIEDVDSGETLYCSL